MPMRSKWLRLTGILLGVLTLSVTAVQASHEPEVRAKHKIVYHLSGEGLRHQPEGPAERTVRCGDRPPWL